MNEYNNSQDYADTMEVTAKKILKIIGFVILGIIIVLVFSFSVMLLWNWLIPDIFGFRKITYFEGIGLLVLAKIFFGGLGSDSSSKSKPKESSGPRDLVSKAIHEEMQQEFKKEYAQKYGDTQTTELNTQFHTDETPITENLDPLNDLSSEDQEKLYDEWWDKVGAKSFDSYVNTNDSKL